MSKSTKSEATTSTNRESLVAAIDLIRRDREAEEKTYGEAAKKPEAKKPAKKAATKKSAKKPRPTTLTTITHANEVSDPSVLMP